jgi:glycosyltransferase involved in cell wall biosynthesis
LVVGVHPRSAAYPNTLFRLHELETSGKFDFAEINVALWHDDTQKRHGRARLTRSLARAIAAHVAVCVRYLFARSPAIAYVPYPSVFVLLFLSALPERLRPTRVVADAFISLYDTVVLDRQLLSPGGLTAKLLKWAERRAYETADQVIADTPQNAGFLSRLFDLPGTKVIAVPLATDELHFAPVPYQPRPGICNVLFVGTLAPLHGVATILEAAHLLAGRPDIRFTLIGDGQESEAVERWLADHPVNLDWQREWQSSLRVAEAIVQSDVCLGIFGTGDKTQRVCPYKLYLYTSVGRATITGDTAWLRDATRDAPAQPFATVPMGDAAALARTILTLADDPDRRAAIATAGRRFYDAKLANAHGRVKLESVLLRGPA